MRVLAVDFGSKRIGIAVGESEFKITTGRPVLDPTGTLAKDAAAIKAIAIKEGCEAVVVGVPIQADGTPGELARVCRMLGERLTEMQCTVAYVDEAGTSVAAEQDLFRAGFKGSVVKKRKDSEAARRILERYFEELDAA